MAERIRIESLIAALLFVATSAIGGVNIRYSFDDPDLATGPDTFAVYEHAKGRVDLVSDIRYSGYNSLAITDVANDGDFPELQGYYPVVTKGMLRFRFAMLVATPNEQLNIALAGPGFFAMTKDGIAFWLKTIDGTLHHISDGIPKKLFLVQPFVWYVVDVSYSVDRGTYDLTITQEARKEPVVALKNQANATSSAQSAVSLFSFVGEVFGDESNVRYYVDDIALATDDAAASAQFVAPGRRKLFIDRWRDMAEAAAKTKSCLPVLDFEDVGASATDLDTARARLAELAELCGAIEAGKAEQALRELDRHPRVTSYALASIIALTRLGRWEEAEERWFMLEGVMRDDIRYGAMSALIGMHRKNWDEAEAWLRAPAETVATWQKDRERKLIAEEYFFVLLWRKEYASAAAYASRVAKGLAEANHDAAKWWYERAGDAELLGGRARDARRFYATAGESWSVTEKLADVAFLLGDAEGERKLREKLYGTLK